MDRWIIRWAMAAGALLGTGTGLLLFWASANAPVIAVCFFVAGLVAGLFFLSSALMGESRKLELPSFDSYPQGPGA